MFNKLRDAILGPLDGDIRYDYKVKYKYSRPSFLGLETEDEIQVSSDHLIRPILVPRDINKLTWNAGYAETINTGKSIKNEDQASVLSTTLNINYSDEIVFNKLKDMIPSFLAKISRPSTVSNNLKNSINDENSSERSQNNTKLLNNSINEKEKSEQKKKNLNNIPDNLLSPSVPIPLESQIISSTSTEKNIVEKTQTFYEINPCNQISSELKNESIPIHYFAIFDGHAGYDVSLAASKQLHNLILKKLKTIADLLVVFGIDNLLDFNDENINDLEKHSNLKNKNYKSHVNITSDVYEQNLALNNTNNVVKFLNNCIKSFNISDQLNNKTNDKNDQSHSVKNSVQFDLLDNKPSKEKSITLNSLIIGALESAFWEMDMIIANDKKIYKMNGGCTVLVGLFILGKLFIANAGDSRAIVVKNNSIIPMSYDFTPETERERIKYLGLFKPELLGNDFTALEFIRRPNRKDLGKSLLCREGFMSGWIYKNITSEDLKFPLVYGEGKRSRVLGTIGVTRGFGDHNLKALNSDVSIKPFLTPEPEVRVLDLENDDELTENDILIMATDGLWDVTSNEKAFEICKNTFQYFSSETNHIEENTDNSIYKSNQLNFKYRYISAAQDLVMFARGKSRENNGKNWRTNENKMATIDDISVFVIPLKNYRDEYRDWKKTRKQKY